MLDIDAIIADQRIYPRISTHDPVTDQYAKAMRKGDQFPPIVVTKLNGLWFLVDGYHRLGARLRNKEKQAECQVIRCKNLEEAYVEGIKRNATHGVPFEPAERMIIATNLRELGYTLPQISDILRIPAFEAERMVIRAIERIPTFVKRRIETEDSENGLDEGHTNGAHTWSETPETQVPGSSSVETQGRGRGNLDGEPRPRYKFFMPMYKFDETLVELLAAVCHQEWVRWSTNWVRYNRGKISESRQRYFRSMWVPYQHIPEERKQPFREWAKKVLAVVWAT